MTDYIHNSALLLTLQSKTVIVTGGANGIGAEAVRQYASHGANVVIADLPACAEAASTVVTSLPQHRVIFIPVDICDWAQTKHLFQETIQVFGRVDIVAANAGIMESKSFFEFEVDENGELKEPSDSYRVVDVNLKGTMNVTKLAFFYMRTNPISPDGFRGSVLLTGSTSSYFGSTGVVAYVASKHGVLGLLRSSRSTAKSLGIRINAVAPTMTPTYMTSGYSQAWIDSGRVSNTPKDVAMAIAQLSNDPSMEGKCCLVMGEKMKEVEQPRTDLIPSWMGEDVVDLMARAKTFWEGLGSYPLPPIERAKRQN